MGAFQKTMEYMGFRDPGKDELDAVEHDYEEETSDYSVSDYSSDYLPSKPTLTALDGYSSSASYDYEQDEPADMGRIVTVVPRTYNEAKAIGDAFREGVPVIMNVQSMSESEARRMIDFASGLIYGLNGTIERITPRVFLLSPDTVSVESHVGSRAGDGIFNQS